MRRICLTILSALTVLFFLRVTGQFLVAFFHLTWLPPMEAWMSGAVSYPVLLSLQIGIIALMSKICLDVQHRDGYFAQPSGRLGRFLVEAGAFYLLIMVMRYAMRMALYPHERWLGGSLPIIFHCVLALFVIVYGTYHLLSVVKIRRRKTWTPIVCRALAASGMLVWLTYQLAPAAMAYSFHLRPAEYAVSIERDVEIPVGDGVILVADIYHPQHRDRSPTIVVRIPYTKTLNNMITANLMGRLWAERGYTAVIQCTRGKGGSGGSYYPLRNERADGVETLRWLERQPWYNGQVAGWGGSTFGYSQWVVADQQSPGLTAMHIYESSTDFYGMFHPGGAFSLYSALSWAVTCHGKDDLPSWPSTRMIAAAADVFPLIDADRHAIGMDVAFYKDWASHDERDAYWRDIDGKGRAHTVQAPVLLMAGWYDPFLPTQLSDFQEITHRAKHDVARSSKIVIGPWIHGGEVTFPDGSKPSRFRPATLALSLDWFDRQFKSRAHIRHSPDHQLHAPNVPQLTAAPIQIFVMGRNLWRAENEWPLARTQYTSFYLNGKQLSLAVPGALQAPDRFTYDPQHPVPTAGGTMIGLVPAIEKQNAIESRADVLCFSTSPLPGDVEVTGPVRAELFVASDAPSTDFTAKLVDVGPDGTAYNVCDGIKRCKFAAIQSIQRIEIELWPTSMVFFKNHQIRLEVSSSNFPRFDRNPNTGGNVATETNPRIAHQTVFHRRQYPSRLILPIIPSGSTSVAKKNLQVLSS